MKKILFSLVALVCFAAFTACSDDSDSLMKGVKVEALSDASDPHSTRASSVSEFEKNWESCGDIITASGSKLVMPWHDAASSNFSLDYLKDMKKEDGWVLVTHSFNLPDYDNIYNHYMAFYNQASGDLKIYINPKTEIKFGINNATWEVYCNNPQSWFNGLNEVSIPSSYKFKNSYTWETTVSTRNTYSILDRGWNVITIPCLTYDPNAPSDNTIQIESYAYTTSIIDMVGETTGSLEGKIIAEGTSNPTQKIQNTISSSLGSEAEKWAEKNLKTKVNVGDAILNGIKTGIGSLVSSGAHLVLNSIFGRFSKTTYSEYNVRLNLKTSSHFDGTQRKPEGTGLSSTRIQIGSGKTGVQLGAWTLSENPTIYIHPVGVMNSSANGIKDDEASYRFSASGNSKADIVINPQLKPHVVSYSVNCVPVAYVGKGTNPDSKIPAYPVSDYSQTDYGSLGSKDPMSSYFAYTSGTQIYSNDDYTIYNNNAQGTTTFWRLVNRYGQNSPSMPLYKYVYAPANSDLSRRGAIKVGCKYNYAKVIVTMITNFDGKTDTIVTSRTYKPRFEWDPDLVNTYKIKTMSGVQASASRDAVLSKIDNGYYDRLLRENSMYSVVRNDSLVIENIKDEKLKK